MQYSRIKKTYLILASYLLTIVCSYSQANISRSVLEKISANRDLSLNIHVVFDKQIDFRAFERVQEASRSTFQERAKKLLTELSKQAEETHPYWIGQFKKIGGIDPSSIKRHQIVNAISLNASASAIRQLAALPGIIWIGENVPLQRIQEVDAAPAPTSLDPSSREKGLTAIGAPDMWRLGYTGYNRLAFIADTGTDPTHPAIRQQYNGLVRSSRESWYSFEQNAGPYDCNRHGTHVTGTVLGLDKLLKDTIGVAFNARWIAGDILCGIGTEDNIGAFEWALNPDGDPETTSDIPDVINNSWYDPSLDTLDCYSVYVPILQALEAAGVAVIFSAGNEGPGPGTITQPHNISIDELNAFTVGALNGNGVNLGIASFSSNGPSHCPGEGSIKIKPEVSAPGVQVRSCVPGNTYALLSGTSMAAPHVCGAILLLKEAFPTLGGKELKHALYHTCRDLGDAGEDNRYGMGLINVYDAFQFLKTKGHVPVSPSARHDVSLLQIEHAVNGCDNSLTPSLLLENNGTDTLYSTQVLFETAGFDTIILWTGSLPPGLRTSFIPVIRNVPAGDNKITVTLIAPNGAEDERTMFNSQSFRVNVTATESREMVFPFVDQVCQNSNFYLTSPGLENGNPVNTIWYDAAFGGRVLYQGNKIQVQQAQEKTMVFAEPVYRESMLKFQVPTEQGSYPDVQDEGIVFDAHAQITLDSVTVYSNQIGVRNFYLLNENGDSITSSKKYINKPGANFVKLNWTIPPGANYKIVKKEGKSLLALPEPQDFPQNSPEKIVTIKGGTSGALLHSFFDWRYTYAEPCGRIPVQWNVRQDSAVNTSAFLLSTDTLLWPSQTTITAKSDQNGASSFQWDMGDGAVYTSSEVTHTYASAGTYRVVLHTTDSLQCITSSARPVTVLIMSGIRQDQILSVGNVILFPNPGNQFLQGKIDELEFKQGDIAVYNSQGMRLFVQREINLQQEFRIDTAELPSGMYLIEVIAGSRRWMGRWVKHLSE